MHNKLNIQFFFGEIKDFLIKIKILTYCESFSSGLNIIPLIHMSLTSYSAGAPPKRRFGQDQCWHYQTKFW